MIKVMKLETIFKIQIRADKMVFHTEVNNIVDYYRP